MSEHTGYHGNSLEFLKTNQISIGDSVKIFAEITYTILLKLPVIRGD